MSNRRKLRVPGRYERPAEFRAPLGDHAGEAGLRAGYRDGNRVRAANQRVRSAAARVTDQLITSGQVVLATVESAATVTSDVSLRESVGGRVTEAPKDTASGRLIPLDIIRSGWNTSGSRYYGADVLERDVPKVYGKGTQMYIDHPRSTEQDDIPERTLQTLAGVFVDTPWAVREADGTVVMRTTARVFGPWQPLIREAWDTIGVSINGTGRGDYGTAEGREGIVLDELTSGRSVDFVTAAGAGGRILGLLESHRPFEGDGFRGFLDRLASTREAGSLGAYVESRIHLGFTEVGDQLYADGYVNREERITLSGAIGDALSVFVGRLEVDAPQLYQRGRYAGPQDDTTVTAEAAATRTREASVEQTRSAIDQALQAAYGSGDGPGGYAWVQDFDPDAGQVWFTACRPDEASKSYQQSYLTGDGGAVGLVGGRVEVRARTVYEPVTTATAETTTSISAGGPPAASNDGPSVPAITTKESDMGEKSPEVVAREAAEAERDAAVKTADEAVKTAEAHSLELAYYKAGDAARPVIDAQLAEAGDLPEAVQRRVRGMFPAGSLPLVEATRVLDEPALRTQVATAITAEKEYAAQLLEAHGAGEVRGNGAAPGAGSGIPAAFGTTRTAETAGADGAANRQALIDTYVARGRTREAAEAAATGRY